MLEDAARAFRLALDNPPEDSINAPQRAARPIAQRASRRDRIKSLDAVLDDLIMSSHITGI